MKQPEDHVTTELPIGECGYTDCLMQGTPHGHVNDLPIPFRTVANTQVEGGVSADSKLALELANLIDARYRVVTPDDPHVRMTCAETEQLLRLLRAWPGCRAIHPDAETYPSLAEYFAQHTR